MLCLFFRHGTERASKKYGKILTVALKQTTPPGLGKFKLPSLILFLSYIPFMIPTVISLVEQQLSGCEKTKISLAQI